MPDVTTPVATGAVVASAERASTVVDATSTSTHDPFAERRRGAYRIERAVYLLFGLLASLIAIRLVLKLLGAGPDAGFAQLIYGATAPFIAPFVGLFGTPQASGNILELHSIAALVVYALAGWLVMLLVRLLIGETHTGLVTRRTTTRTRVS